MKKFPKPAKTKSSIVSLKPRNGFDVFEYESVAGKNFYKKWFDSLPSQQALKVSEAIRRMEAGNLGDHKGVGKGVFEHRIHNPALRIYFGKDGDEIIVLLVGGSKADQSNDIKKAQNLCLKYKNSN